MKVLRIIARAMSAIFVVFALVMFIGEAMQSSQRGNPEPMSPSAIIGLAIFGVGLLGLLLAWKWELAGGIISLIAFISLFIFNQDALVWVMLIFPVNAILFLGIGYQSRAPK
jgi:hypothetical protein